MFENFSHFDIVANTNAYGVSPESLAIGVFVLAVICVMYCFKYN